MSVSFMGRPDHDGRWRRARAELVTARERQVLTIIRNAGDISRSDVIKASGLSGVAVFRVTEDLAARGLVEIGAAVVQGRGQPSSLVRLNPMAAVSVGLSIMNDFTEAVMLDFTGAVIDTQDLTVAGMPRVALIDALSGFIDRAVGRLGIKRAQVLGVGIAIAGFFVGDATRLNPAPELDDWALIDLQPLIEAQLELPVVIENSASAAAVGERLLGTGRRLESFYYLNFAAGFGAGLVIKGELARGHHGNAGEVGALLVDLGLPLPRLDSLRDALSQHGVDTTSITDLIMRYQDDWPGVAAWVEQHTPSLRAVVAAIRHITDVEAIIIGGRAPRPLAERIAAAVAFPDETASARRHAPLPQPQILIAESTLQSTAVAAASMPLQAAYFR